MNNKLVWFFIYVHHLSKNDAILVVVFHTKSNRVFSVTMLCMGKFIETMLDTVESVNWFTWLIFDCWLVGVKRCQLEGRVSSIFTYGSLFWNYLPVDHVIWIQKKKAFSCIFDEIVLYNVLLFCWNDFWLNTVKKRKHNFMTVSLRRKINIFKGFSSEKNCTHAHIIIDTYIEIRIYQKFRITRQKIKN